MTVSFRVMFLLAKGFWSKNFWRSAWDHKNNSCWFCYFIAIEWQHWLGLVLLCSKTCTANDKLHSRCFLLHFIVALFCFSHLNRRVNFKMYSCSSWKLGHRKKLIVWVLSFFVVHKYSVYYQVLLKPHSQIRRWFLFLYKDFENSESSLIILSCFLVLVLSLVIVAVIFVRGGLDYNVCMLPE